MEPFGFKRLPPTNCLLLAAAVIAALLVTNKNAAASAAMNWQTGPDIAGANCRCRAPARPDSTSCHHKPPAFFFTNHISPERYVNGSGVAVGDMDGDGFSDLYFCGLDGPNVLYRNLGNSKFEDVTLAAGVACPALDATGAVFADIDGDGDPDLIVNSSGGGTHVYINANQGHFTEQTKTPPLNHQKSGASLALADLDGDGDLDLYVANYRTRTICDQPMSAVRIENVDGQPTVVRVNNRPKEDVFFSQFFLPQFRKSGATMADAACGSEVMAREC